MNRFDEEYLELLGDIHDNGVRRSDRTGTGTYSIFGPQMTFDLSDGSFPLLTTKKVYWAGVVHELLWMIGGGDNVEYLNHNKVHIWDEWADESGALGPVYGAQWRRWRNYVKPVDLDNEFAAEFAAEFDFGTGLDRATEVIKSMHGVGYRPGQQASELRDQFGFGWNTGAPIDQLALAIDTIRKDPNSRRIIVSAWNVAQLAQMALPPCHAFFQFYCRGEFLDLKLYQRSADMFLGVPFNIASYSLLLTMVAQATERLPGRFIHSFGDAHIYANHVYQVREQLEREPREAPKVRLTRGIRDIDHFRFEDITLLDYDPWPTIKAPISV